MPSVVTRACTRPGSPGHEATDGDNVAKLLRQLDGVADRRARFRTVAYVATGRRAIVAEGVCEGTIAEEPRGEGGFGYDPVFVPTEGDGRTFAEMAAEEKHAISHRGRAFRALAAALGTDELEEPDVGG